MVMRARWRALLQRGHARTARDLFRLQPRVFRTWMRHVRAVEEALGRDVAMSYSRTVVAIAPTPDTADELARVLPDLLAQVAPANRARFHQCLIGVIEARPVAAVRFARALPELLDAMDDRALANFVSAALAIDEDSPHRAESFLRMESSTGRSAVEEARAGTSLRAVHRQLTLYARAHCGEAVQIRPGGDRAFTDGRHLYLPNRLDRFGDERDEALFLVMTARAAGFIEFGSLDIDLEVIDGPWPVPQADEMPFDRMLRGFQNPVIARILFLLFERVRIDRAVRSAYPGVARRMDALEPVEQSGVPQSEQAVDRALEAIALLLRGERLTAEDSASLAARAAMKDVNPAEWLSVNDVVADVLCAYGPIEALMDTAPTFSAVAGDLGFDPGALGEEDKAIEARAAEILRKLESEPDWESARSAAREDGDGFSYAEMDAFLERMEAPAGPQHSTDDDHPISGRAHGTDPDVDADGERAVFRYPEWDHGLGEHKPEWVRLTEYSLRPGDTDFVDGVMAEHGPMIGTLRRCFEALRPDGLRPLKGLTDGEELDIDAVLAARMARRAGVASPAGLYRARQRVDRDVAVAFLVDMSSSTNEHINTASKRIIDVEREALVVVAEAVHALGDASAIYGYSGFGREQVAFYVAKDFADPWDQRVRERIGRIGWKMENRDGAAIRHATQKLASGPGKVKLLLLLSDGKPLDCGCDQYSDDYAQEDTRMALIEARKAGVHPFCITVDPHGRRYLQRMYGSGGYTIIDSVEALPQRLPAIYRRLTR
jgi:hypothetical protein